VLLHWIKQGHAHTGTVTDAQEQRQSNYISVHDSGPQLYAIIKNAVRLTRGCAHQRVFNGDQKNQLRKSRKHPGHPQRPEEPPRKRKYYR